MPLIYKLDPRTKILLVSLFAVLVFVVDKLPSAAALLLFLLVLRIAGKVPFRGGKSAAYLSLLAAFMVILQILFGPGENYILKPLFPPSFPLIGGWGSLKRDGLILGLVIACRLTALVILMPLLTATTAPEKIACGLASLRLNYRIAFIITTAFNLIPLFEEEGRLIMDAQKLRGMRVFEKRSFWAKLKAYPGIVVPLVLGAMRKAQAASVAMDARAFGVYGKRTWLDKPVMKTADYICIAVCVVFSAVLLFYNFSRAQVYPCP